MKDKIFMRERYINPFTDFGFRKDGFSFRQLYQSDEEFTVVVGGKVCGAGGGGFIVFFVPPENKEKVKEKLKNFLHVPFRFENIGTHVIYYSL